jgi:hypothetical protein
MMGPHRRYTIAGRRFEDALRVERDRQIAELRAENEKLRAAVRDSIRVEAEMFARLEAAEAELGRLKEPSGSRINGLGEEEVTR